VDNTIVDNLLFDNGGLAIDLTRGTCPDSREACPDGVNYNDFGDGDQGPNRLQNFPERMTVTRSSDGWQVDGHLVMVPGAQEYQLQFFANTECDPLGHGEAETLVKNENATTEADGTGTFSVELPGSLSGEMYVSATATSPSGSTSELSPCVQLNPAPQLSCADVEVSADETCHAEASIVVAVVDPDGDEVTLSETPPGPYPLGETSVTAEATDEDGAMSTCTANVEVVDTTSPMITCPDEISLPAEDGSGATVDFVVSADDNCSSVTPSCTQASGSLFGIGTTPNECSVVDDAGLETSCSFPVHVLGAQEQAQDLREDVLSLGLISGTENSLLTKLDHALDAMAADDSAAACQRLATFISQVNALRGVQIPVSDADDLVAAAQRIRRVLGC
jgi:hypothetical protein